MPGTDPIAASPYQPFRAHVTQVTLGTGSQAGLYLYTFWEQSFDTTSGTNLDASPGRITQPQTGAPFSGYAFEVNNANVTPPFFTEMRFMGVVKGVPVYEFQAPTNDIAITSCVTWTPVSGSYNNVVLPATSTTLTEYNVGVTGGNLTLTGIDSSTIGSQPPLLTFINTSPFQVTFTGNSSSSLAANRFYFPPSFPTNLVLNNKDTLTLWYDSCATVPGWYVQSTTASMFTGALFNLTGPGAVGAGGSAGLSAGAAIYDQGGFGALITAPATGYYAGFMQFAVFGPSMTTDQPTILLATVQPLGGTIFSYETTYSTHFGGTQGEFIFSIPFSCHLNAGDSALPSNIVGFSGLTGAWNLLSGLLEIHQMR